MTTSATRSIIIGVACLAAAVVLARLSSLSTMTVVRTSPATADVSFEDKLFGLVPVSSDRVRGVRSARTIIQTETVSSDPVVSGGRGNTTRFLQFETDRGAVFAGPSHHYFARYSDEITAFVADTSRSELVASVADERSELVRFLFAQACVLLFAVVGGFTAWSGVRQVFASRDAGIGPR